MTPPRLDDLLRLLNDMCDGPHGGFSSEVFALHLPSGHRLWYCRNCWYMAWQRIGKPPQPTLTEVCLQANTQNANRMHTEPVRGERGDE